MLTWLSQHLICCAASCLFPASNFSTSRRDQESQSADLSSKTWCKVLGTVTSSVSSVTWCPVLLICSHTFLGLPFVFSLTFLSKVKKTRWMLLSFTLAPRALSFLWICSVVGVQVCEQQVVVLWGQAASLQLSQIPVPVKNQTLRHEVWLAAEGGECLDRILTTTDNLLCFLPPFPSCLLL